MSNFIIDENTILKGTMNFTYMGVPCHKCPFDYALYQKIIFDVQPDLIIEIGTNAGGSALYMAGILDAIGGDGEIHTIDVIDVVHPLVEKHRRIKTFLDGWDGYDLKIPVGYRKVMVIDDGSHRYSDVIGCLNKFKDVVSVGSYFIVEDGIIDKLQMIGFEDGSPTKAISEFLSENNNFMIDRNYCNFYGTNSTFNINGYLKKIK